MKNFGEDIDTESPNSTSKLVSDSTLGSQLIQLDGTKRISVIHEKLMLSSQVLLRTSKDSRTYLLELLQSSDQPLGQLDKVEVAGQAIHELSQINSLQEFSVNQCHYVVLHPSSFYIRSRQENAVSCGQLNQYHNDLIKQYPNLRESLCDTPLSNSPLPKSSTTFRLQYLTIALATLVCLGLILLLWGSTTRDNDAETSGNTEHATIAEPPSHTSIANSSTVSTNQRIAPTLHQSPHGNGPVVANHQGTDHLAKSEAEIGQLDSVQNAKSGQEATDAKPLKKPSNKSNEAASWKKQETLKTIASYVLEAGFDPDRARKRLTRLKQQTKDPEIIMRINESLLQMGYQP